MVSAALAGIFTLVAINGMAFAGVGTVDDSHLGGFVVGVLAAFAVRVYL